MKIGYRTLKTAVGTPLSIWIAEWLQLDYFVSAGILTLLCIQPTRKRSIQSALHRFGACLLAMLFASVIFELAGYHPVVIGVLLVLFIPVTVRLKLTPGIVTSSVILLHLYSSQNITGPLLLNELALIIIGIGIALLLNLYMPNLEKDLHTLQQQIESNFRTILEEIAIYLKEGRETWTGKELMQTEELLREAEVLVAKDIENHLLRNYHPYFDYFVMRKKQLELLQRMLPLVSQTKGHYPQSDQMGDLFHELAKNVHPGNTATIHLQVLKNLRKAFAEDALPRTREEFETRANLFRLHHELEQYLILKRTFKESDV